jgi:hypothetical protein
MDIMTTSSGYLRWKLWYQDMFDRDTPVSLEDHGENILEGLYGLWYRVLMEGIQDNGNASFSYFFLTSDEGRCKLDTGIQPTNNRLHLHFRNWSKGNETDMVTNTQSGRNEFISKLAANYFNLLQQNGYFAEKKVNEKDLIEKLPILLEN